MTEKYISMRSVGNDRFNDNSKIKAKINFSENEVKDLIKAWIVLSLSFAVVLSGFDSVSVFIQMFLISSLTVGTGFLLHELAHKIVAQNYGCWAEFKAFNFGLIIAFFMSLFGFIFAAPGAVMINGIVSREKNGKISLAGPFTNMVLAIIFLLMSLFSKGFLSTLGNYGFVINSWLALFNLIPIGIFDGAKVLDWSKTAYGFAAAISITLVFVVPGFL